MDLFPSGEFSLYHNREKKLSNQYYFLQRLQNQDLRFAKDTRYIFAAEYFVEPTCLQNKIDISMKNGKLKEQEDDTSVQGLGKAASIFRNIRGSPLYFSTLKSEMLANCSQIGSFQVFISL